MPRSPALTRLAALLVALALAGCRGGTTPASSDEAGTSAEAAATAAQEPTAAQTEEGNASDDESARTRPPASASPETASAEPTTEKCATMTGAEAISTWGPQVPTFREGYDWQWNLDRADPNTYDPCAALSWVVLGLKGGMASSPVQIMLFHRGQYIGVTASEPINYWPEVVRLDDAAIQVTYKWPRDGETTAGATGRSVSIFTWDEQTQSVVHSGEWPPGVAG